MMTLNFCLWRKANTEKLSEASQLSIRLEIKVKNMSSEEKPYQDVIIQPVRLFPCVNWMPFTTGAHHGRRVTALLCSQGAAILTEGTLASLPSEAIETSSWSRASSTDTARKKPPS